MSSKNVPTLISWNDCVFMECCLDNAHKIAGTKIMLITTRARRALPANESPVSLVGKDQRPDIFCVIQEFLKFWESVTWTAECLKP